MLEFQKYHGLGNDFVVIDAESPDAVSAELARQICDRHFGVGADGVLILSEEPGVRARMTVINQDGSVPEMCGNGLRCAALHLARQRGESEGDFEVLTDAGKLLCELRTRDSAASVRIGLGRGELGGAVAVTDHGRELTFQNVSMGNPHAVIFGLGLDGADVDQLAPAVASKFPSGANVECADQIGPREFNLIVHERGVGRTLACGTGAGATAVAAVHLGLAPFNEALGINLPGGRLEISVAQDYAVHLTGPARHVFSGSFSPQ